MSIIDGRIWKLKFVIIFSKSSFNEGNASFCQESKVETILKYSRGLKAWRIISPYYPNSQ